LHLQVDPCVPTGEVPYPARLVIVERAVNAPTGATGGFFPRRWSRKIRTLGAPKTPQTMALGRKPGKRYVSARRRSFRIRGSCQIFSRAKSPQSLVQSHFRVLSDTILPTQIREEPEKKEAYQEKMEAQLKEWNAKIEELRPRARQAAPQTKIH